MILKQFGPKLNGIKSKPGILYQDPLDIDKGWSRIIKNKDFNNSRLDFPVLVRMPNLPP